MALLYGSKTSDSHEDDQDVCLWRTTIILVLFLSALGIPETGIGLFMTLTLIGDIGVSTILTVIGDGMGVRFTMAVGSVLMMGSGVVFAVLDNYWLLLVASIIGVINPR